MKRLNVGDVTTSNLGFELIEKEELAKLKEGRNITGVPSRFFLSSDDLLIGYGFSRCQAVVLLNGKLGALLHNHPMNTPSDYISGNFKEKDKAISPQEEFSDMQKVRAFHIYHRENHSYPETWIQEPLTRLGVKEVAHVPILNSEPRKNYWMDVALDVKRRTLYVIPTDFQRGIKLNI